MMAASALANVALKFGPPEFFAIGVCGLILLARLSGGSVFNSFIMILLGIAVSTVGLDFVTSEERFTFGIYELGQGIEFCRTWGFLVLPRFWQPSSRTAIRLEVRLARACRPGGMRSRSIPSGGSVLGFDRLDCRPPRSCHLSSPWKKLSKYPKSWEGAGGRPKRPSMPRLAAYVLLMALAFFTPAMAVVLGFMT
jgi:putative tricarboxylic transport membrane protein